MFPATDATTAEKLIRSQDFEPFYFEGHLYNASLVDSGIQPVLVEVNGQKKWSSETAYEVVFKKDGAQIHSLRCSTSSPERILAHWQGLKQALDQHSEHLTELRSQPSGQVKKINKWKPEVGGKVRFSRGMYGKWTGTIVSFYNARSIRESARKPMALISFRRRNGTTGTARKPVSDLTQPLITVPGNEV